MAIDRAFSPGPRVSADETNCAGMQPCLWVDRHGRRFTNKVVGLNFGHAGDMVAGLPGAHA